MQQTKLSQSLMAYRCTPYTYMGFAVSELLLKRNLERVWICFIQRSGRKSLREELTKYAAFHCDYRSPEAR